MPWCKKQTLAEPHLHILQLISDETMLFTLISIRYVLKHQVKAIDSKSKCFKIAELQNRTASSVSL